MDHGKDATDTHQGAMSVVCGGAVTVDRFDDRAAELIACSIPGVCKAWAGHPLQVNGHLERCVASLRPAVAQALRDLGQEIERLNDMLTARERTNGELREGAKRARRENANLAVALDTFLHNIRMATNAKDLWRYVVMQGDAIHALHDSVHALAAKEEEAT